MTIQTTPVRDGVPALDKLARDLCRILSVFGPIIRQKYSGNAALMTALVAAEGMCALLPEALHEVMTVEGDNSDPLENPETIPGVNPSAPPFIPPEEEE